MTHNEPAPPPLQGIHHLKLPVSDLDTSLTFYQRAFGARRIPAADHRRASDGSRSSRPSRPGSSSYPIRTATGCACTRWKRTDRS